MENKKKAARLLDRYLHKKSTQKEIQQVDDWYQGYEDEPAALDPKRKLALRDEMLKHISGHINAKPKSAVIKPLYVRLAGAAVLLIGLSLAFFFLKQPVVNITPSDTHIVATGPGQTREVKLNDGSVITMQASTKLVYNGDFKSGPRTVQLLNGEAFFKIHHDASRSFIVKLPHDLYTQVLGTSFNISVPANKDGLEVVVKTGRVALGNDKQVLAVMTRGDRINYYTGTESVILKHATLPNKLIRFDRTPLRDLARRLETEYDVRISLPADVRVKQLQCTGTFETNQAVEEILHDVCLLHHLKLTAQPDKETFTISQPMTK